MDGTKDAPARLRDRRIETLVEQGRPSQSRLRTQSARLKNLENDHHQLADERESLERNTAAFRNASNRPYQPPRNPDDVQGTTTRDQCSQGETTRHLCSPRRPQSRDEGREDLLIQGGPFSTSDVVQAVRDLNSEIMQTAAYLAETLPLKRFRTPSAEEVPEGPYKSIFVTLVLSQGSGEEVDVGSLELALQGLLALYASGVANAWGFEPWVRLV
jgi:hypothetical protein